MSGSATADYTLRGTPAPCIPEKIRSYLIKKGVPFRQVCPPIRGFAAR